MIINELRAPNGTVFIRPPQGATATIETLEETPSKNVYRIEWSHGLICILTESKDKNDFNPVFNYSVYDLGNGNYEIDYAHKNPGFVDRKNN